MVSGAPVKHGWPRRRDRRWLTPRNGVVRANGSGGGGPGHPAATNRNPGAGIASGSSEADQTLGLVDGLHACGAGRQLLRPSISRFVARIEKRRRLGGYLRLAAG